jgi:phage-related protein
MLKQKILNEQNLSVQEKLASVADKFKTALFKAIKPLLPAIEAFANSLLETNGPIDGMFSALKGIASVLGIVFEISMNILRGVWYPFGVAIDFVKGIFNGISKVVKYIKEDIFGMKDATKEAGAAAEEAGMSMEVIKTIALAILLFGFEVPSGVSLWCARN